MVVRAGVKRNGEWDAPDLVGRKTRRAEDLADHLKFLRAGFEPRRGHGMAG
jgi:hypothetical protein